MRRRTAALAAMSVVAVLVSGCTSPRTTRSAASPTTGPAAVTPVTPTVPAASPSDTGAGEQQSPAAAVSPTTAAGPGGGVRVALAKLAAVQQVVYLPGTAVTLVADGDAVAALLILRDGSTGLVRVDTETGRVTGPIDVPRTPDASLAVSGNVIWVGGSGDNEADGLLGYDAQTLARGFDVTLPGAVTGIAASVGRVWLVVRTAHGSSLRAVDPATGRLLPGGGADAAWPSGQQVSLAAAGNQLWTAVTPDGGGPVRVALRDGDTGQVLTQTTLPVALAVTSMAAAPDRMWLAAATGMLGYAQGVTLDGATLTVTRAQDEPHASNGLAVSLAGGRLWLVDRSAGSLQCAEASTGRSLAKEDLSGWVLGSSVVAVPGGRVAVGIGSPITTGLQRLDIAVPLPVCAQPR